MKKIFLLSPILFVVWALVLTFLMLVLSAQTIDTITQDWHIIDCTNYTLYLMAFLSFIICRKDFAGKYKEWMLMIILLITAVLREMGAQHWLTEHDTTAIKLRFFTNPNNPLSEKIITALVVLAVVGAALYLLIKNIRFLIRGVFKFNPIAWTVGGLFGTAVVSKIFDRLPGNIKKYTGSPLDFDTHMNIQIFEEGFEMLLPAMVILAIWQYHYLKKKEQ